MPGLLLLAVLLAATVGEDSSLQTPAPARPDLAPLQEGEGRALIRCDVTTEHQLANCEIESEEPAGCGYGEAALRMSKLFKMRPKAADGSEAAGARITIPVKFAKDAGGFGWQPTCPMEGATPAGRPRPPAARRRR